MMLLFLACTPDTALEVEPVVAVAVTDFAVGGIAFANEELEVGDAVFATTGDPLVRALDGVLYVIERGGADVVSALDPFAPQVPLWQTSLPAGANVHDLVLHEGRLWATAFGLPFLYVLDPEDGALLQSLDLSEHADEDGLPELDGAAVVDGRLFVAAQRLDQGNGFLSAGGRLLEIDPAVPAVVDWIDVGPNPRIVAWDDTLLVATGHFATPTTLERIDDGLLRRYDPATEVWEEVSDEASRQADLWQAVPVGDSLVLLEILADGRSRLSCRNDGVVVDGPTDAAWFVTATPLASGLVAVGARTGLLGAIPSDRGLIQIDPVSCQTTSGFSSTPLDPYDLSLL